MYIPESVKNRKEEMQYQTIYGMNNLSSKGKLPCLQSILPYGYYFPFFQDKIANLLAMNLYYAVFSFIGFRMMLTFAGRNFSLLPHYKFLIFTCVVAVILRIAAMPFLTDISRDYYWEYGELAKNMAAGKGYSLWYYAGTTLEHHFTPEAKPHISGYMPPGYPLFMLPFIKIENVQLRNILLYGMQSLLIVPTILALWALTNRLFSRRAANIAAVIMALLPEFLYASVSAGPTSLYHALLLWLLLRAIRLQLSAVESIMWGVICAVIIYLRSEFAFYTVILAAFVALRFGWRHALLIAGTAGILIIPWQIRNYVAFGQFIPMTTSSGLNFYRGHNPEYVGSWGDSTMMREIATYRDSPVFEVNMNDIYVQEAMRSIRDKPSREISYTFTKLFHLWLFNPDDRRALHPAYLVPWIALLACFIIGLFNRRLVAADMMPLLLFWATGTIVCVLFFALPRYQTLLKPALLPVVAVGAEKLWSVIRQFTRQTRQ